jgi:beta-glucanase (GH16 family)
MDHNVSRQRVGLTLLGLAGICTAPLTASGQAAPACASEALNVGANGPSLDFNFGTGLGRNVRSVGELGQEFWPRSSNFGTETINHEWQYYADFNDTNHHFAEDHLELTAVNESETSIEPGRISSAEITSLDHFYPVDGQTLLFQLRAKIPHGAGTWPAFWLYSPGGEGSTDSEIDIFEFWNNETQDTHDWTGYDHGNGVGQDLCSNMTNEWVWHPGTDFADDYHVYTLVWREGQIEKWVDEVLIKRSEFEWFGPWPQLLINLAIGGDQIEAPTSATFPAVFSLDYLRVYVL